MKRFLICFINVLFVFALLCGECIVLAADIGFSTEAMSDDEKDTFLNNVNLFRLTSEPDKKPIQCFDISDDGLIAIGTSTSTMKTIAIYNQHGDYQYGYQFKSSGSFGLEWDTNNLIIYFVRSDVAMTVNSSGETVELLRIQNTAENNSYWNNVVHSDTRVVGDAEYTIRNSMGIFNIFAPAYSQLILTDVSGTNVIYDASSSMLISTITFFVAVLIVVAVIVLIVVNQFNKQSCADNK